MKVLMCTVLDNRFFFCLTSIQVKHKIVWYWIAGIFCLIVCVIIYFGFPFILSLLFVNNFNKSSDDDGWRYYEGISAAGSIPYWIGSGHRALSFLQLVLIQLNWSAGSRELWKPFLVQFFSVILLYPFTAQMSRAALVESKEMQVSEKCSFLSTCHSFVLREVKFNKISKTINKSYRKRLNLQINDKRLR